MGDSSDYRCTEQQFLQERRSLKSTLNSELRIISKR